MESKTYLLVFSILLTYYSYLCDICKRKVSNRECECTVGYDELGIYSCFWVSFPIFGGECKRSSVNGTISSCESAFDDIKDRVSYEYYIFDIGTCEKINNTCYYDEIDENCHLRKCEELKDNCTSLQYCDSYENTC